MGYFIREGLALVLPNVMGQVTVDQTLIGVVSRSQESYGIKLI